MRKRNHNNTNTIVTAFAVGIGPVPGGKCAIAFLPSRITKGTMKLNESELGIKQYAIKRFLNINCVASTWI